MQLVNCTDSFIRDHLGTVIYGNTFIINRLSCYKTQDNAEEHNYRVRVAIKRISTWPADSMDDQ